MQKDFFRSIRVKMITGTGLLVLIVQVIATVFGFFGQQRQVQQIYKDITRSIIDNFSQTAALPIYNFDNAGLVNVVSTTLGFMEVKAIIIRDIEKTKVICANAREASGAIVELPSDYKNTASDTISQPIRYNNADIAIAEMAFSDAAYRSILIRSLVRSIVSNLLITVILISALFLFIQRLVSNPIDKLHAMLQDIAEGDGDLTKRLDDKNRDEIGELARNFNVFIEKLQGIITTITGNADTVASSSAELSAVSSTIAANSEEMSVQTSMVASATEEASSNINIISSSADVMSQTVNSVASAIEEMSASLNEVARNCKKELDIAEAANNHARGSKEIMDRLGAAAKSINNVVEVINDIADQTNLLALNATIEAASAGDAGRGFAVVATEVKELAKQTAVATQEIEKQIEDMQSNALSAAKAIDQVTKVIAEVNALSQMIVGAVEQQIGTVNEVATSVGSVRSGAEEVARNVTESAKGLSEISHTIAGVNSAVSDTAQGVTQVKRSADDLSRLSENLKALLGQFKV